MCVKFLWAFLIFLSGGLGCRAQTTEPQPKVENVAEMKFVNFPNVPTCFTGAVEQGDPINGPSTILVKGMKGCEVPMHFHSAQEQVVMIEGKAQMLMRGGTPQVMKEGAFASAPPRSPHDFTCLSTCQFYVISDGKFDIHYVDDSGKEIPFVLAVKSLQKPADGK
jgi:quercetin dioxygenase-like cupin family protein